MTFVQKVIFCRVESLTLAIEKYVRIEKMGVLPCLPVLKSIKVQYTRLF